MDTSLEKTFGHSRSEISFREILEHAPIGVLIFQRDWKIKFVNNNFFLFNGVVKDAAENVVGKSIFENRLFYESDIREELNLIKKGETFEKEIVASRTLNGGTVTILLKGAPIIIENEYTGGVLILEDIKIDNAKAQGSLVQSSDFQKFLSSFTDFYIVVDKEGIVEVSPQIGMEMFDFLFEPDWSRSVLQTKKYHRFSSRTFLKTFFPAIK